MNTNARNYSLDLLRILATFMVVVLHVQLFGGLLESKPFTVSFVPTIVLESFCIVAVNCFVLITGFFMIHKDVNGRKLLGLVLEIAVISWMIFVIGTFCGLRASFKELVQHIFPTLSGCHWFISSYIIVYILSPWFNKLILSLTRKECFFLAGLLFVLFSVWGSNPKISAISVHKGYSVLWLTYIYFIGSIIRLYGAYRVPFAGRAYTIFSLFTTGYAIILCQYTHSIWGAMNYNSPFVLLGAVSLFYVFYSLQITSVCDNRIIKFLTPGCFGVFLIHTDLFIRPLYRNLFARAPVWLITLLGGFAVFAISIVVSVYIHKGVFYITNNVLCPWIETKILPLIGKYLIAKRERIKRGYYC